MVKTMKTFLLREQYLKFFCLCCGPKKQLTRPLITDRNITVQVVGKKNTVKTEFCAR